MLVTLSPMDFLEPHLHFAVVEASNDNSKSGFAVYAALKKAGFSTIPINALERMVQGDPAFPNLKQAKPFPDAVIFTILEREDPQCGLELLQEMRDSGIFRLWAEPCCDTYAMREFATQNNIFLYSGFSVMDQLLAVKSLSAD